MIFADIDWSAIFVPSEALFATFVRGTIMYLALFALLRFFMRRQTGGLGISDVLVIVVIADAAQNGMAGEYRSIPEGLLLVVTIVFWDYVIDWVGYRIPALARFMRPEPLLIVKDGVAVKMHLEKEKITHDELMSQLRLQGVDELAQVKLSYIEGDGRVSVVKRDAGDEAGGERNPRRRM